MRRDVGVSLRALVTSAVAVSSAFYITAANTLQELQSQGHLERFDVQGDDMLIPATAVAIGGAYLCSKIAAPIARLYAKACGVDIDETLSPTPYRDQRWIRSREL